LLKKFRCNTVLRLTLLKGYNMLNPEQYAEIISSSKAKFIECKAYMWVGYSRQRLQQENMPRHEEIREFAEKIAALSGYRIKDEKKESRVVLLQR
jgi:tRNA wybutosine-synthesizing protein 1